MDKLVRPVMEKPILVAIIPVLLIVGLAMSWAFGSLMVRATSARVAPAKLPAEDLYLVTPDGFRIAATFWPGRTSSGPAVLLLHGNGSSRAAMTDNAIWLSERGYAVLAIDFRGHGESTPASRSFGFKEARDAHTAFTWLKRTQHNAPVAVVGVSLGGAAALIGEEGPLAADALVLQAVYPDIRHAIRNRIGFLTTDWLALLLEPLLSYQSVLRFDVWPSRLAPISALPNFSSPVLLIGGAEDRFTPPHEVWQLYRTAKGSRVIWIEAEVDHVGVCDLKTDRYREKLLQFLHETIGKAGGKMSSGTGECDNGEVRLVVTGIEDGSRSAD